MTNEDKRAELITKLIDCLIDDPRKTQLEARPMTRRVNWKAKVAINDTGKLIGKLGAHLKAIRVLVGLMGQRFGEDWRFAVEDPDDGERREPVRIERVAAYDPAPATAFLGEILGAILDEPAAINLTQDISSAGCSYTFTIAARVIQDYERLVEPFAIGYEQLAPVAALGTIFRAYGRQQGVDFRVFVPGRKV